MIAMRPMDDLALTLARCLNLRFMRDELNRSIHFPEGVRVASVRVRRFSPRRNNRFDLEYILRLTGPRGLGAQRFSLFARCPGLEDTDVCHSDHAVITQSRLSGICVNLPGMGATFHTLDMDPTFPGVDSIIDPGDMAACLSSLIPSRPVDPAHLSCKLLTFRPGRRVVVELCEQQRSGLTRRWAGKRFARRRGRKLAGIHQHVADHFAKSTDGTVRLPNLVGFDKSREMIVTEWRETNHRRESWQNSMTVAKRSAQVLAALHAVPTGEIRQANGEHYWQTLARWSDLIVRLRPEMAEAARMWVLRLAELRPPVSPSQLVTTHGDFYEAQLIIEEESTTLLDLDTLAVGNPCLDLGNALGHFWLTAIEQKSGFQGFAATVRIFLSEYESLGGSIDEESLIYYWAATVFRAGALHTFRSKTCNAARFLWEVLDPLLRHGLSLLDDPITASYLDRVW